MLIDYVLFAGMAILGLFIFLFIIASWANLFDLIDDKYDYCYNCKYGFCTETPRSNQCQKWRDEHENKNIKSVNNK